MVALELGEQGGTTQYGLQPFTNVSEEEILEAVHLLERPQDRLIEELFWVHEMDGLVDGHRHQVLDALSLRVSGTHGAVARHNLAVMLSVLGQECTENCRLDHWKEALKRWKELMDDDLFWTFMQGRARRIDCQKSDCAMMKAAVRRQLSSTFSEEMVRAVKTNELRAVPVLASLAMEHKSWLDLAAALKLLEQQEIKDGFVSLGAILDRISGITQQDNKADIRSSLAERERELRSVADEYGDVVGSLAELVDVNAWLDAVARSYQRLSGAYLGLLGDLDHAIRLIVQAREFARDPQLLESMERDRQTVQRAILCRAAEALARGGDFAGAEQKLASALAISDEEQKTEIEVTRDLYRSARESMERDKRHVQWATLCREVDALVKWGDFDAAERKLASALAMATEERKLEIKAMQDRYRWVRLLRGVDITKKNPILYTLNGFGAMFYGKRDYDRETRSYVTNHWLTFLFVPVFPFGAYRVTDADFRSYYIHGKAPLPNFLKQARWAIAAAVIILVLMTFIGRGTSTKTVGAASTIAIASTRSEGGPEASPEKSSDARHSERDDIEQERAVLTVLAQLLDDRKRKLDGEDTEIQKQNRYLASVRSSYAKENVPGGGQSTYQAVWAGYDRKVQKYNADLAAWKTDYAVYNERVTSLNARQ
ncbi:MAG: hypothetical protein WCD57_19825 [Acidobacteriaceae bacterium]